MGTDDRGHDHDRSPSGRSLLRLRRRAAGIVAGAVRDLRPGASFHEIRRLVEARCEVQGVPPPSHHALRAKIADVRRYDHAPKMVLLDHCIIATAGPGSSRQLCTLHVAVLDPPGMPLAWRMTGTPADPAIDADLLIDVQGLAGPIPDARVRLAAGGSTGERIGACLGAAGVEVVARIGGDRGMDAKRALAGSPILRLARLRAPRAGAGWTWAAAETVDTLRPRIELALGGGRGRVGRVPVFGLAPPHLATDMISTLRTIAEAT